MLAALAAKRQWKQQLLFAPNIDDVLAFNCERAFFGFGKGGVDRAALRNELMQLERKTRLAFAVPHRAAKLKIVANPFRTGAGIRTFYF